MHTIYKTATGEIVGHFTCVESLYEINTKNILAGQAIIRDGGAVDGKKFYFRDGAVMERPAMSCRISKAVLLANGLEEVAITGLPRPCTVTLDGKAHVVDDGSFSFSVDQPGHYKIKAESFPHISQEWEVVAK